MNDLVKRLRASEHPGCREAADEIERLDKHCIVCEQVRNAALDDIYHAEQRGKGEACDEYGQMLVDLVCEIERLETDLREAQDIAKGRWMDEVKNLKKGRIRWVLDDMREFGKQASEKEKWGALWNFNEFIAAYEKDRMK